jgi:hypothetical protein
MIVYGDPETWGMTVDQFLDSRRLERESFADGTNPKIKMILDMLRRGMDVDTISTITGATVEEINNIAKTAKPISTEELSPEEPLSKNKTYSEIDILSNIDAKNPGGITGEDVVINPMPNPVPRMDEYMPEAEVIEDPRYRQLELADGGIVEREGFSQGSEALEKYSPEMYNKFLEISKKYEGTGVRIVPNIDKGNLFIRITTEPRYKDFRGKDIKLNYRVDKLGEEGLSQIEKNADAIVSNISPEYQKQRSLQVERMQTEAKKKSKIGLYGTREETVKQVNQIIKEVAEGKRPLFDLSKLSRGELLEGSEYKKTTDFLGYDYGKSKPRFLTKKNFKIYQNKIEPYLKSIRTTVSMNKNPIATEEFKNATIDTIEDLRIKYPSATPYDIPKNVGQHMMKSIERHVDKGGKKFTKISGDNISNYIFKETSTGKKFSADIVNKNPTNKKWKNYVDVYNNVKDINYNTQFIDKTTGELTTPTEAYRKLTNTSRGVPVEFEHFDELGVFGDPIKNVGISPVTANKAANIPGITEEQLQKGFGRMSNIDLEGNRDRTVKFLQKSLIKQKMNPDFEFKKPIKILENLKTIDTRAGEEKIKTIVENIGCPTGALKAANGANCYIKGAEKIQAGKLNQNEFNVLQKAVKSPAVAKAVKYGGVALKGLGALFAPLMVYDTYTEYKKGKPISEALEYGLLGTNIIGGTRDELKLTPREREARGVQQQYEREQQDVSGLSSDFYFPSDLSVDQAAKIYEQGQDRVAAERAAEEEQAALENVYQGDPGILDYSEYAYGGRVGLEKGSDPKNKPILPINPMIGGEDPRGSLQDPGRRDVLKGMGLLGAGVAAGKLGLLKLGKAIKKAPLTSIVKPMGKTMTQFPTWFPTLVNRIRKEGTQIPIFKTKDVNISKQEYDALKQQGTKNLFDQYIGRTENYVNELKQQGIPRYYQKVNTDEIIGYKYEVKDLPNVKVTDLAGKEIRIDFPNAYGKDVTMTYKAPKVSVDMQGKKVKYDAEFQVDDAVPESGGYPGDVPDFYGEIVNNLDEVYGGASQIEQYALKLKKPRTTQGDKVVNAWDVGQPHMSVKEIRDLELKKQKKQERRNYAKQQVDETPATFEDREFLKNFLDAGDDID